MCCTWREWLVLVAGPGGRMGFSRVVEHLPGSMEPSNVTLCDPSNFAMWGQVYRREICRLLTRVVQRMEVCVRMLDIPVLSPYSLTTDWLLYPVPQSPLKFPGTKASPCEVQITGDLLEVLPSALSVYQLSTRASHLPSLLSFSLLLSVRC